MISPEARRSGFAPESMELSQWAGATKAPTSPKEFAVILGEGVSSLATGPISLVSYGLEMQPSAEVAAFDALREIDAPVVGFADSVSVSSSVKQLFRVAIDGTRDRWPALRTAVDQLGYASTAFDSLRELTDALDTGQQFGLLLLTLPEDADAGWLQAIRKLTNGVMLFVVDMNSVKAMNRIGNEYTGANNFDFVLAPFGLEEIKIRTQLLLNRSASATTIAPTMLDGEILAFGEYVFYCSEYRVFHRQKEMHLQRREYEIALGLFKNMNHLMTREKMHALLWRDPVSMRSRALDVHVSKIRKKLNIKPENGLILSAIYGRGYQLRTAGLNEIGELPSPENSKFIMQT